MFAAASARSNFFSPRDLESKALIPTPVPAAKEIRAFCIGKARVTAVRASSESLATNILSTTLYRAWTSMDIIMGSDIVMISFFTGMTPILFSLGSAIRSSLPFASAQTAANRACRDDAAGMHRLLISTVCFLMCLNVFKRVQHVQCVECVHAANPADPNQAARILTLPLWRKRQHVNRNIL